MQPTKRILLAAGSAAVLAGIAAGPVLAQDASSSSATAAAEAPASDPANRPSREDREARRAEMTAALAEKLGVSGEDLTAAQQAARDAVVAAYGEPTRPDFDRDATDEEREAAREAAKAQFEQRRTLHDQTVADTLGISVDQLSAARQELAREKVAERLAAGDITQEQADEMLARIDAGELPGPGGPGGRGGHHGPRGPHADGEAPPADAPDAPADGPADA